MRPSACTNRGGLGNQRIHCKLCDLVLAGSDFQTIPPRRIGQIHASIHCCPRRMGAASVHRTESPKFWSRPCETARPRPACCSRLMSSFTSISLPLPAYLELFSGAVNHRHMNAAMSTKTSTPSQLLHTQPIRSLKKSHLAP